MLRSGRQGVLHQPRKSFQVYRVRAWQHCQNVKRYTGRERVKHAEKDIYMKHLFLLVGLLFLNACDIPLIPGI